MIVDLITELVVVDVLDRGVPNQERVLLRVNEQVNLGLYGLLIGLPVGGGFAFPIRDNFFWFGDGLVNAGDFIFVYTGPGEARANKLPNTEENVYSIHWGRKETVFANETLIPILFRFDGVNMPGVPLFLPDADIAASP